jgi:predicted RNA-binding Zn-ribbon protein involved in translation (DUF1610 family)
VNELLDTLGDTLAAVVGHPAVVIAVRIALVYLVVLWLAAAWWVWRDARARYRDPLVPYVAAAAVVLVTPLLFPLAAVVYRLVRPSMTTAHAEATALQLAMLEEEAVRPVCAGCGGEVDEEWVRCPSCGTTLSVRCESCGRPLELDWTICAWCAAEVPWAEAADPDVAPVRVGSLPAPVAIPIRPGGRPLVPVMAVPEEPPAGEAAPEPALPGRRRVRTRRRTG